MPHSNSIVRCVSLLQWMGRSLMETKPGYLTTEFWVTMFGNLSGLLNLVGAWDFVPNKWIVIALAVLNGLYAVSRGQAKQGIPYTPNQ